MAPYTYLHVTADFQWLCVLIAQDFHTAIPAKVCFRTAEGQVCRGSGTAQIRSASHICFSQVGAAFLSLT